MGVRGHFSFVRYAVESCISLDVELFHPPAFANQEYLHRTSLLLAKARKHE